MKANSAGVMFGSRIDPAIDAVFREAVRKRNDINLKTAIEEALAYWAWLADGSDSEVREYFREERQKIIDNAKRHLNER